MYIYMKVSKKEDHITWHAIIVGFASIIVLWYRVGVVGYPLFMEGIREHDYNKIVLAITMLV